jgi:hypothetical protein
MPVDPTFNQFPADATHIRFTTGNLDRQSDIIRLVGKLKVEVLEYNKMDISEYRRGNPLWLPRFGRPQGAAPTGSSINR